MFRDLDRMLGIEGVDPSGVSSESEREGGKVVSFTHWPPLHIRRYIYICVCVFVRACIYI